MMYLPLFHLFGFSEGMLTSMVTGARQILTETFNPAPRDGADNGPRVARSPSSYRLLREVSERGVR